MGMIWEEKSPKAPEVRDFKVLDAKKEVTS